MNKQIRYHIMFSRMVQGIRKITVMDFSGAQQITFSLDALYEDKEVDPQLVEYIKSIEGDIKRGRWDYKG